MAEEKKTMEAKESKETKDQSVPEWLLPILTGLGSLGGTYALWVKPLQEALKKMSEEIQTLKDDAAELKHQLKKRRSVQEEEDNEEEDDDFIPTHQNKPVKRAGKGSIALLP